MKTVGFDQRGAGTLRIDLRHGALAAAADAHEDEVRVRHCRSEINRAAFAERLVRRGDDAHRVDGVVHVRGEVEVFADGFLEIDLLAFAQAVMTGVGLGRDDLVGLGELTIGTELRRVHLERLRGGVGIDVGGITGLRGLAGDDRDAAFRTDDVLHEEGLLGHHRTPAGLIPADGTVGEGHLEVAVVDLTGGHVLGETGADPGDADRTAAGHEAHHVDVVHAAVDDGGGGAEEIFMRLPIGAGALLVEVHPHHEGFAQSLRELGEFFP